MWKPTKDISISSHSVRASKPHIHLNLSKALDLKAEMLKKKEEYMHQKQQLASHSRPMAKLKSRHDATVRSLCSPSPHPYPSIFKQPAEEANKNVEQRKQKDLQWLKQTQPANERERQRILEHKSKLYDRLHQGQSLSTKERSLLAADTTLIDFERKHMDMPLDEERMVEIEDEFGRLRRVPEHQARSFVDISVNLPDDYKQYEQQNSKGYHMVPPVMASHRERVQREQEAAQEWQEMLVKTAAKDEHYDASKDRRDLGAVHYNLSSDREERKEQMTALRAMEAETMEKKSQLEKMKQNRKRAVEERLKKIREMRGQGTSNQAVDESAVSADDGVTEDTKVSKRRKMDQVEEDDREKKSMTRKEESEASSFLQSLLG